MTVIKGVLKLANKMTQPHRSRTLKVVPGESSALQAKFLNLCCTLYICTSTVTTYNKVPDFINKQVHVYVINNNRMKQISIQKW